MTEIGPSTRRAVAGLSIFQGAIFLWAAFVLPWHYAQLFTVLAGLLGLAHLATVASALFFQRAFGRLWRASAFGAFLVLLYLAWVVGSSVSYMASVYGRLGAGLGAALLTAATPAILLTVPTSIWAIAATGGLRRRGTVAGLVVLLGFGGELVRWGYIGQGKALADPEGPIRFEAALHRLKTRTGTQAAAKSLMTGDPVECAPRPGLQVVATYFSRREGVPKTVCLSESTPEALADGLDRRLAEDAISPRVKLDLLVRSQSLDNLPPLASPFVVRPGLDAVCGSDRCLMPWQLVALAQFTAYRPVPFIPDLRLGIDPEALRKRLNVPSASGGPFSGLKRVEVVSWVRTSEGAWQRFRRFRPIRTPAKPQAIVHAGRAAGAFVHRAQADDGRFMYRIQPFQGRVSYGRFSVARQAGTTLVLCELGAQGLRTKQVAERSLRMLAGLRSSPKGGKRPEIGALTWPKGKSRPVVRMGPTALALIAFITCRDRLGITEHDEVIASLGAFLLALQTPSGRFAPYFSMEKAEPIDGSYRLYADGQAVFGLVLMEQFAKAAPQAALRPLSDIREAAARAMRFYGSVYWRHPARDFFFVEENWHCLAARAALRSNRVEAYERFCLDYVRFKTRLVLSKGSRVYPDAVGGYGFANFTAPFNTPTAGFGEAASAALALAKVRDEPLPEVEAALRRALDFLVHTQWTDDACFACSPRIRVPGAYSESLTSPIIRIDYVQHAWAALAHGARVLSLEPAKKGPQSL